MKQTLIWLGALILGAIIGIADIPLSEPVVKFIASIFVRLFQLLAIPTIILAVVTTLSSIGNEERTGRIFRHTISYTVLTTFAAAAVGLILYVLIAPDGMEVSQLSVAADNPVDGEEDSYSDHLLSIIPNNSVRPLLEGNVLSLLILAIAAGMALLKLPDSEGKATVIKFFNGLQEIIFLLIRWLVQVLPIGIMAFAAQLSAELSEGVAAESLCKYILVVLGGNAIQFFVVLPLFLLARGLNPAHVLSRMMPAVMMALFTKSSAATLPVTMDSAENRLGVRGEVARFVLPICTTINMNGCAAFILVTSLFAMQSGGWHLTLPLMLLWLGISVVTAIGNAGVPMGCYFITFSLMSGIGAPVEVLGAILPIYTIIDMVETAENVWSDSCVCAMTNHDTAPKE